MKYFFFQFFWDQRGRVSFQDTIITSVELRAELVESNTVPKKLNFAI